MDVAEYGETLRQRRASCRELVQDALARRDAWLSAYRSTDDDACLAQADAVDAALRSGLDLGPWMGVPVSVKDLYGVPGFPTYAGSPSALPPRWERPGPLVLTLRRQLAIVVGKTHTVEFAFGGLGTNPHTQTPRNPWDATEHRAPGGSSSGAGVSLHEGSALLALGTDTAGSVRIPASYTSNFGLKTSHGRWSLEGIVPLSPTLDTAGILTRSAADLELAFATLDPSWRDLEHFRQAGPRVHAGALRIARSDTLLWDEASPGVCEAVEGAVTALARAGATVERISFPEVEPAFALFCTGGPVPPELAHFLQSELPGAWDQLDANVRSRAEAGLTMTALEYLERRARLRGLAEVAAERLREYDVLVSPTVVLSPPSLAELEGSGYAPRNRLALRNTSVMSYMGLCALTIPVGFDALGLPVGMMLTAKHGDDARLVAIARAVAPILGS